jgi:hypothetical protein
MKAVSAHLWILVSRCKTKSRGKKILLKVSEVNSVGQRTNRLTSLRTRVKKTRWQRISLPLTLVQHLLETSRRTLQLRVTCIGCGKVVRPVIHWDKSFRRSQRRSCKRHRRVRGLKEGLPRARGRQRKREMKYLKEGGHLNNKRPQPFLLIRARYVNPEASRLV